METMNIKAEFSSFIETAKKFITVKESLFKYNSHLDIDFKLLKNKGVVYFIFVTEKKSNITTLKYIGKSKGDLFKQRITNHFDHSHEQTGTKRQEIQKEIAKKNTVEFSFFTTEPESLRNLIEEELINIYGKELWNGRKHKT